MRIPFSNLPLRPAFSAELIPDTIPDNYPRQVNQAHFSNVQTKMPSKPEMVHYSNELAEELGMEIDDPSLFLAVISGKKAFPKFKAFAMCYGGHQFGHWAGQLGDGRAINILETEINNKPWTFQLKGAGPTPYSRTADGFAVLRSSIREYLCSEAMHHLGVPTTRALSLVKTGDWVMRDMLYNGNQKEEIGAVVCRVSPSFIRFGNFEILSARGQKTELKQLVDFTIQHHFSDLGTPSKETYLAFFQRVVSTTKDMIVHWQRVGFVHGVMNTDNMSILGLTIDYGPYGWLDNYDGSWTPNTTDREHRRYRSENQPNMALWNLVQLANALFPLIEEVDPLEKILESFKSDYQSDYHQMMCAKLGLLDFSAVSEVIIDDLKALLFRSEIDMTLFYRKLSSTNELDVDSFWSILLASSYETPQILESAKEDWMNWLSQYTEKLKKESIESELRLKSMKLVNPKYVLRNYMAQMAIDEAENGNNKLVEELYQLMLQPYAEQPTMEKWFAKRPDWAKNKVGCSMLSCSS
jgi:uncharacterized protein YdiU (UPF0061 family)